MPHLPPHILAAQRVGMMPGQHKVTDYTRYFKRFGSSLECGFAACKDMNYREHFHCAVPMCNGKDFAKKEEMIRHSKWHQKMDEALKYGFRRVTPMDDCSDQFQECGHNKKQTHYHCIQSEGCDKVYISTSDVQMHFNYHRKDNAIQREGFMRFRGAEDCHTSHCLYRGRTLTLPPVSSIESPPFFLGCQSRNVTIHHLMIIVRITIILHFPPHQTTHSTTTHRMPSFHTSPVLP